MFAPAKKVSYDRISVSIVTFHAYLMIIVGKLARILRGRNGDQHLDLYHRTQRLTGPENKDLDRERQKGRWHRARIPRQPRRVGNGFQRWEGVCSYLSRNGRTVSKSGSVFEVTNDWICD